MMKHLPFLTAVLMIASLIVNLAGAIFNDVSWLVVCWSFAAAFFAFECYVLHRIAFREEYDD
jgi:hypothetical protein